MIFRKVSYDDLKAALENWLNPDSESNGVEVPSTSGTSTNGTGTETTVKKSDDISAAFDDLFDK